MARRQKTCLVLGGGGSRGLSHLGVLKVLERERISLSSIVGTSVGAVVGAAYALQADAEEVTRGALEYFGSDAFQGNPFKRVLLKSENAEQNFFQNLFSGIRKSYVFSNLLRKRSIFPAERLFEVITDLVPDRTFAETKIPFAVPALDVRSGTEVLLTKGSLRQAVFASCSLPGFFPPVEHQGMLLSDAGTIGPIPVRTAKAYFRPDATIAVDITTGLEEYTDAERGLDTILRVEAIGCKRYNEIELEDADVVIRPEVGNRYWSDFSDFEELVHKGEAAAEARISEIRSTLRRKRFRLWDLFAPARG